MPTALIASCPNCKLQVTVNEVPSDTDIATVICIGCGKKFGLRFPPRKGRKSKPAPAVAAPFEDPFANLAGALPDASSTNVSWEDYRVRKPLIAGKPLAIAIGATAAIACLIAFVIFVGPKAAEIDINAIGESLLKGPADTVDKIYADWVRYDEEQRKMTAAITHQSECDALMFPMERLEERHLNLLIRGALLEQGATPNFTAKELPPAPSMQPPAGKNFRAIEALLTIEFRAAEKKLNLASNAVLSYLHSAATPFENSDDEAYKRHFNKILIKRDLCRALAEAHRGSEESKTAVTIYELTEELKKLDESAPAASQELEFAEFTATQMQAVLAARFTKNPESEIAKALAAFDQAY